MASRILALLVSVAMVGATASVRAGQAGDDPQFLVRIQLAATTSTAGARRSSRLPSRSRRPAH